MFGCAEATTSEPVDPSVGEITGGETTSGETTSGEVTGGSVGGEERADAGSTVTGGDSTSAGSSAISGGDSGGMSAPGGCTEELCDGLDNDCDGRLDEEILCPCSTEDTACYGGPIETRAVGLCTDGARSCDATGEFWGACEGWVGPEDETCDGEDNDCDGEADEGVTNACGTCEAETPVEVCDGEDNDCDGQTDEGVTNVCGACGDVPVEVCDGEDNDCDGQTDEGVTNVCGACGDIAAEVCNGMDDDCDGQTDEGVLNACGACGAPPAEDCNGADDDCDGQVDEGVLNACGVCGAPPMEVCDLADNDCDGVVDEDSCVIQDLDLNGDCLTVSCPPEAPYPIACQIDFQGSDPRGCVAYNPPSSEVYLQEGNDCGSGRVVGTLTCSQLEGGRLNANNCPINKPDTSYPRRPRGCADTN